MPYSLANSYAINYNVNMSIVSKESKDGIPSQVDVLPSEEVLTAMVREELSGLPTTALGKEVRTYAEAARRVREQIQAQPDSEILKRVGGCACLVAAAVSRLMQTGGYLATDKP